MDNQPVEHVKGRDVEFGLGREGVEVYNRFSLSMNLDFKTISPADPISDKTRLLP